MPVRALLRIGAAVKGFIVRRHRNAPHARQGITTHSLARHLYPSRASKRTSCPSGHYYCAQRLPSHRTGSYRNAPHARQGILSTRDKRKDGQHVARHRQRLFGLGTDRGVWGCVLALLYGAANPDEWTEWDYLLALDMMDMDDEEGY